MAAEKTGGVDGHHEGEPSLLTGKSPVKIADLQFSPRGISVDQRFANYLGSTGVVTRYASLQFGVSNDIACLSYAGDNQTLAPQTSPDDVFSLLFQNASQTQQELAKVRARRKSILDGASAEYASLSSMVSGEDKRRIDAHLEAVRDLESRLSVTATCDPSGRAPNLAANAGIDQQWKAFLDLSVLAFACDLTRVITLAFNHGGGGGISYPWLGIGDDWHELSHAVVGEDPNGGSATDKFVAIHRWHSQQLAYFVAQLKATASVDGGTLFDETVMLTGSELGFDHCHYDIPFLVFAGDKTPVSGGRYVNLAPARPIQISGGQSDVVYGGGVAHNNMLLTLLHALGVPDTTFGDPSICTGDLDAALLKA